MMFIIVALLPGLSNLEILSNDTDLLLGLIDHIRTEEWPLYSFRPIQRSPTFPPLENLKWSHLQTSLIAIVVGELCEGEVLFPTLTEGNENWDVVKTRRFCHFWPFSWAIAHSFFGFGDDFNGW